MRNIKSKKTSTHVRQGRTHFSIENNTHKQTTSKHIRWGKQLKRHKQANNIKTTKSGNTSQYKKQKQLNNKNT